MSNKNNHRDPTDIHSREDELEAQRVESEFTKRQEAEDFKWLMSDKRGRRIVWRLLSLTGVFRNPFTGDSKTFFRCGEMNIGQTIWADVQEFSPEKYPLMANEARNGKRKPK